MEYSNITYRKPKSKSFTDISMMTDEYNLTNNSSCFDGSTHSLPNTSITDNEHTKRLHEHINNLKIELESANEEIERISLENMELKKTLEQREKTLSLMKNIGICENYLNSLPSPSQRKINSAGSKNVTPSKCNFNSPNRHIIQLLNLEKYVKKLEQDLEESNKTIDKLNDTINRLQRNLTSPKNIELNETISSQNGNNNDSTCSTKTPSKMATKSIINIKNIIKRKIVIIADQQGRGVRHDLQNLVGNEFLVICLWKPGATMYELVCSFKQELLSLTSSDYVILLGGINEKNPVDFRYNVEQWVNNLINTNILICEIPYNKCLNEKKLNYELRFICNRHSKSAFVEMGFDRFIPNKFLLSTHISRCLLKDILRQEYQQKLSAYHSAAAKKVSVFNPPKLFDKCTQTDVTPCKCNCTYSNAPSIDYVNNNSNKLFRE